MRTSRKDRIARRHSRRDIGEDKDKIEELLDSNGDVKKVGDLSFEQGILGKGSYGTVRLAKRPMSGRRQVDSSSESPPSNGLLKSASMRSLLSVAKDFMSLSKRLLHSNTEEDEEEKEELVAVKIFRKSTLKRTKSFERSKSSRRMLVKTAWMNVEREIAICKRLAKHPNIVRLYEVLTPESDMLYMVLEYCQLGEILTYQKEDNKFRREGSSKGMDLVDGHFDTDTSALFMVDILHGLSYLHDNQIAHRDVKPENILLSETSAGVPIAKLSDFGVAHTFDMPQTQEQSAVTSPSADDASLSPQELVQKYYQRAQSSDSGCAGALANTEGTMCFWSPEMCQGNGAFSAFSADVWAAGVCLYIFVSGRLPFFVELEIDLIEKIANADVPLEELGACESLLSFFNGVLARDPNERASVGNLLQHPFLKEARATRMHQLADEGKRGR